jgi:cysteine-rich repeat protein
MIRHIQTVVLVGALAGMSACESRTYVLVTVDTAGEIPGELTQLRFVSNLVSGAEVISTDERLFPEPGSSEKLTLPNSFVIVADGRGADGERVQILIEGLTANKAAAARGRGDAPVVPNKDSSTKVFLSAPCTQVDDCLGGALFCDNPYFCNCDGDTCDWGYCEAVSLEDGNDCTVSACNETGRVISHVAVEDGTACEGEGRVGLTCVQGICGCGDGITNSEVEECDEGQANANSSNRCRVEPACTLPRCGDGILDDEAPFFEECDDGPANSLAPNACRPNCKLPACGDQIIDAGEQCDDGIRNSDTAPLACRTSCARPSCGDGVLDTGVAFGITFAEECDLAAGNSNSAADGCRQQVVLENGTGATVQCKLAFCGDGVLDSGERCDDNNSANGDGCNPTCTLRGEVSVIAGAVGGPGTIDGTGSAARILDVSGMASDGGFVYFTGNENHTFINHHTIRRASVADGTVVTLAGRRQNGLDVGGGFVDGIGVAARFFSPAGVAVSGANLFVADAGNHALRRMSLVDNSVTTVAGNGLPAHVDGSLNSAQFAQPRFVTVLSADKVLVFDTLTSVGCRLRQVDLLAGQVTTLAGAGGFCFAVDGTGTGARFGTVSGMALAADGKLYVADSFRIRQVDLATNAVLTVAGASSEGFADNTGTAARFRTLGGIVAGDDELFVADRGNHLIRRVDLATFAVTTVAGTQGAPGATDGVGGLLSEPTVLALSEQTMILTEFATHTLRRADLATFNLETFVGSPAQAGQVDGPGSVARFKGPDRIALVGDQLFIGDNIGIGSIRSLSVGSGTFDVATLASSPAEPVAGLTSDGAALYGTFAFTNSLHQLEPASGAPTGLTVGGAIAINTDRVADIAVLGSHMYVAALGTSVIRRVDLSSGLEQLFAGSEQIEAIADGTVDDALFKAPIALVGCRGNLYVAETAGDSSAHVIRGFDFSVAPVAVRTIAGAAEVPGHRDGPGRTSFLDSPEGLACDGQSLYVGERGSHVVRQIRLDTGEVSTLAGSPYQVGSLDGTGANARFNGPGGLVYDPASGDLFVTDRTENVVRRIQ